MDCRCRVLAADRAIPNVSPQDGDVLVASLRHDDPFAHARHYHRRDKSGVQAMPAGVGGVDARPLHGLLHNPWNFQATQRLLADIAISVCQACLRELDRSLLTTATAHY